MSKLARALALTAMLAAMHLAGMTAIAQAHTTDQHASRAATDGQVAPQQQAAADTAHRRALAQERYYSTWRYSNTPAPAPVKPSGQPSWLVPGLGVLTAVMALATGLVVLTAKRAGRRARVRHAA